MRPFAAALRDRLAAPLPGLEAQLRMAPRPRVGWDPLHLPEGLRDAAGLLLLYPVDDVWHVPLTLRASALRHHTGQVSLPGGRVDAGETFEDAALREAEEEVGLARDGVEILGRLTSLHIPISRHLLHPVVAVTYARPTFRIAEAEVARLIEVPLTVLRAPDTQRHEERRSQRAPDLRMQVPYFQVDGAEVWGATAMVLAEFLAVVEAASSSLSR